ncbi:CBS domain-containing protein [Streptomyces sp. E2N166]|uniref:CBS domain-containing protein n=1 Tax=Streptomyces sp. E2N166 TaxID=1851909 RepID=UPI000EF703BA|nr:CBS domain-containing protein [Streptomyces sp. E2N166]
MTLVQLQTRSVSARPVPSTVVDVMDAAGPQVWYDMTVEVALSVMAAARTEHLVVCDEDGLCVGLVTQARLAAVRDSSGYTDRIRLGDITDGSGPFVSPLATREEAEDATPSGRLGPVPVVDEHGNALGILALSR